LHCCPPPYPDFLKLDRPNVPSPFALLPPSLTSYATDNVKIQ
jgi:hypothetical protein